MNTMFRKTWAIISSILLIFLCLPLERPDSFSDCLIVNTVGEPACNLLSDELEIEIRVT